MNEPVCLQVSGVGKRYGGLEALTGISLNVRDGVRQAILGPNGAGKTTLFKILSGEIAPSSGTVSFRGHDITHAPSYRRAALGIARTFQITTLFPRLTTLQNVILAVQGIRRTKYISWRVVEGIGSLIEEAQQILGQVGLAGREAVLVDSLAYGEQRQLEIGLALASRPSLLLLDEPTAGLARAEVCPDRGAAACAAPGDHHPLHRARHGCGVCAGRNRDGPQPGTDDRRGAAGGDSSE